MKILDSRLILAVAIVAVVALAAPPVEAQLRASAQVGANCAGGLGALWDEIEQVPLSAAEEAEVLYLREEEKLARDVYLTLAERWQLPIFSNIARAEQQHMDLVFWIIEAQGLIDPVTDDARGAFVDPELDGLYDKLTADGQESLVAALTVGAIIEDMDLADLLDLIEFTDNDQIEIVAYNLAKGSRNHLRAFMRALAAQGATYTPRYLQLETFEAVLAAEMERQMFYNADGEPVPACGAGGGGFGMRRGYGQGGGGDGSDTGNCDGTGPNDGCQNGGGNGTGAGTCDGTGPNGGGNGTGTGTCDGTGPNGGGNGTGTGTCDGTGPNGGGNRGGNGNGGN